MRKLFAQNTTDNSSTMNNGMMNSNMGPSRSTMDVLAGLGNMVPMQNLTFTPQQFGATDATMMRASGGPTPGLNEADAGEVSADKNTNDIAILNSALLLEYLESEFYARVVAADQQRSYLRGRNKDAAQVLARDEATHAQTVAELIRKLGGTPIEKPQFQFPANAFISQIAFLQLSVELEENGVGAYLGAAPDVKNKDVLNFAASIYGNETRHAAWVRYLLGSSITASALEQPRTIAEATANAAPFIVGGIVAPAGVNS